MEIPTNRSTRVINEGAVVALVQSKIDALQRSMDDYPYQESAVGKRRRTHISGKIGALQTVISGLRWCPDAATDPHNAGGNFPILEEGE